MERFTTYECITVKAINLMLWMITAALPVAEATLGPLQEADIFGNEKCFYGSAYEATFLTDPEDFCVALSSLGTAENKEKERQGPESRCVRASCLH